MCANAALLGPAPLVVSGCVPFCKGNVAGGFFCLVCCVRYDNNGESGDVTTEGNAPWCSQGGAFLLVEKRSTVLVATLTERRAEASWLRRQPTKSSSVRDSVMYATGMIQRRFLVYFTFLLRGISGISVNNLPLSFSTALTHSAKKPPNAKVPGHPRHSNFISAG